MPECMAEDYKILKQISNIFNFNISNTSPEPLQDFLTHKKNGGWCNTTEAPPLLEMRLEKPFSQCPLDLYFIIYLYLF